MVFKILLLWLVERVYLLYKNTKLKQLDYQFYRSLIELSVHNIGQGVFYKRCKVQGSGILCGIIYRFQLKPKVRYHQNYPRKSFLSQSYISAGTCPVFPSHAASPGGVAAAVLCPRLLLSHPFSPCSAPPLGGPFLVLPSLRSRQ